MRKNNIFLLLLLTLLTTSVSFTSCSSDDDDDNNNNTTAQTSEYDSHAVDLSLPSGTLWADQNIGANAPEEFGDYYAWGAVEPFTDYNVETYNSTIDYKNTGNDWGGNEKYDVVTLKFGSSWRTPSASDWNELILNTTKEWTTQGEVKGLKLTGSNGNSIFLPATGYALDNGFQRVGFLGTYVSSSIDPGYEGVGVRTEINAGGAGQAGYYSFHGCSVRGIKRK